MADAEDSRRPHNITQPSGANDSAHSPTMNSANASFTSRSHSRARQNNRDLQRHACPRRLSELRCQLRQPLLRMMAATRRRPMRRKRAALTPRPRRLRLTRQTNLHQVWTSKMARMLFGTLERTRGECVRPSPTPPLREGKGRAGSARYMHV